VLRRHRPLLRELENDETLLVQSGKPVAIFKSHAMAPRVLISNAMLVPHLDDLGELLAARSPGPDHLDVLSYRFGSNQAAAVVKAGELVAGQ